MKKFLIFLFVIFSILYGNITYAATLEEEHCFQILSENVKNQYNVDLSNVVEDEKSNEIIDLSSYENFLQKTFPNPKQIYHKGNGNFFAAKRNNIGTLLASDDYILSQFTGFGNVTDFTFPLKTGNVKYELGDRYPDFRQNIVYTHHLLDGTFVSCAYLKITPKGDHGLFNIGQKNYKTNVFEGSGFELLDTSKIIGNDEFLVGKVAINAEDYADKPLFNIQLITVAYNNKNSYFNEFETFPKSVESMTDPDNQQNGMWGVMEDFRSRVENETCLDLVHTNTTPFPEKCNGKAQSLSSASNKGLQFAFIPQVSAKIEAVENYTAIMEKAKGLMTFEGFPSHLYKKLYEITDENFKNALLLAVMPNYKEMIQYKIDFGEELSDYEQVFYTCDMSYTERMDNVIDLLTNIEDPTNIDYINLSYLNPKFGDCVIPYQDKEHMGQEIKNGFSSIKITIDDIDEIKKEEEITNLVEEKRILDEVYNNKKLEYQKKLEAGEILSEEILSEIKQIDTEYEKKAVDLLGKIDNLIAGKNEEIKKTQEGIIPNVINNGTEEKNIIFNNLKLYFTIVIFLLLGGFFIFLGIRKKHQ